MAPKLMRFPLIPACTMPVAVSSIERGIASAVMRAARMLPKSRQSTTITKMAPSARLRSTVFMVASTSFVRLSTVFA